MTTTTKPTTKPSATCPLPPEPLHLTTADAPAAQGRCVEAEELMQTVAFDLDGGQRLYLHLGPQSVATLLASVGVGRRERRQEGQG